MIGERRYVRGIKFANVPFGRSDMVPHGSNLSTMNTIESIVQKPASISYDGTYSGVVKFRFRSYKKFPVPSGIRGG